jgi:hypothetical protein
VSKVSDLRSLIWVDKFLFIGIGVILLIIGLVLFVKPNTVPATQVRDVVVPASVVMIILGLAALAYPFSPFFRPSTPESTGSSGVAGASRTPTVSATPAPTATAPPVPIAVTSPADGAGVKVPFVVSGTAPDLGEGRLSLF